MKTEYKKVSELLALDNVEVLKEFEMVELQGGKELLAKYSIDTNVSNIQCPCIGKGCIGNGCKAF